jgi:hypothetical protein
MAKVHINIFVCGLTGSFIHHKWGSLNAFILHRLRFSYMPDLIQGAHRSHAIQPAKGLYLNLNPFAFLSVIYCVWRQSLEKRH